MGYTRDLKWLNTVSAHSLDSILTRVRGRLLKALGETKFKYCAYALHQKVVIESFIALQERHDL